MLISFSVANFLSFKEKQTLEFEPEALKELKQNLHIPYLFDPDARLLKSIALYGHNSHGKTNFLKAYSFFIDFIFKSFSISNKEQHIEIENFKLNTISLNQPTFFEVEFYLRDIKYRYGFKISSKKVLEEWLYYTESKIRENYLFHRIDKDYRISKTWNKEADNRVEQSLPFIKSHHLLLTGLITLEDIPKITTIEKWLKKNIIVTDINADVHLKRALIILALPNYRALINKFIEKADLGFVTIFDKIDSHLNKKINLSKEFLNAYFEREIKSFELYVQHNVYDEKYRLVNTTLFEMLKSESSGSIKYLVICCYLAWVIKEGQLILIDELDSSFHSLLLKVLIETYNDPKVNTTGSQMIFTTHNTILLNKVLRRDQIMFIEKSEHGESSLRRLHTSSKPIRIDTPIEREYRKGKLGGVSKKLKESNEEFNFGFE